MDDGELTKDAISPQKLLTRKQRRKLAKEEKRNQNNKKENIKKLKKGLVGLLTLIVLFFGGYKVWSWMNTPSAIPQNIFEIGEDDWVKGNVESSLTLIEYADYECPVCAVYFNDVNKLVAEFGNDFKLIYRHFPLVSIHKNAIPSAKAAEAAGKQNMFWEMSELLFAKHEDWADERNPLDIFVSYADELGLDTEKFKSDYESSEISDKVNSDLTSANQLRLNQTPTFFLNGEKIENPQGYEEFKKLLEKAINP